METLEKVVKTFVEERYNSTDVVIGPELQDMSLSPEYIKSVIEDRLKERIVDEVKSFAKEELDRYAKCKYAEAKNAGRIAAIKQLLWEGFVIAIFVGLLGNEVTTLIDFFKHNAGEPWHLIITIGLIVIYSSIVLSLYIVKFTKDLIKSFTKKGAAK